MTNETFALSIIFYLIILCVALYEHSKLYQKQQKKLQQIVNDLTTPKTIELEDILHGRKIYY